MNALALEPSSSPDSSLVDLDEHDSTPAPVLRPSQREECHHLQKCPMDIILVIRDYLDPVGNVIFSQTCKAVLNILEPSITTAASLGTDERIKYLSIISRERPNMYVFGQCRVLHHFDPVDTYSTSHPRGRHTHSGHRVPLRRPNLCQRLYCVQLLPSTAAHPASIEVLSTDQTRRSAGALLQQADATLPANLDHPQLYTHQGVSCA